jgi:Ca2+-binding RTX toxin-like protein
MVLVTGTSGNDRLVGTPGDDTLITNGGIDTLLGRAGADTYQLTFGRTFTGVRPIYTINETKGGDGAIDTISAPARLAQSGNFADFARVGTDGRTLVIETAFKQNYYNSPGIEPGTIKIVNQYNTTTPGAQVEVYMAGGVAYNLLISNTGTAQNDIMTGWNLADTFNAGDGDDYITGGKGADHLYGEGGNDIVFGGAGNDRMYGGFGNDTLFGGRGKDRMSGGDGDDRIDGNAGMDILKGEGGDDVISGGGGNDRLLGGQGRDTLEGGTGNDILTGGKEGDLYLFTAAGSDSDVIIENGKAPIVSLGGFASGMDEIRLTGYASEADGMHSIDLQLSGNDLVITYENPDVTPGETGQITVQDHFLDAKFAIDQLSFGPSASFASFRVQNLRGDGFTYSVHGGIDVGGDDIVLGTTGDDQIYGGIGSDIMLGGAGADRFIYNDEEDNRGGTDIILDFDLTQDILDFTEIKTLTRADLTIADNAYGNAVISSIYSDIELKGITTAEITDAIFDFF